MIPKMIHYCWFGDAPLPELALRCIESWKKYCPDYDIKLWNERNIDVASFDYMREAYEEKVWGFVPDVARLLIIYENGGIYLDTDVELIKPIDDLLDNKAFVGMENETNINLGLGFGAEKGNPIIQKMLYDYSQKHFRLEKGILDQTPSPKIQTEIIKKVGYVPSTEIQYLEDITVYPTEYFCPLSYRTGKMNITENTRSIHHFMASWVSKSDKFIHKMAVWRNGKGRIANVVARIAILPVVIVSKIRTIGVWETIKWCLKKIKNSEKDKGGAS